MRTYIVTVLLVCPGWPPDVSVCWAHGLLFVWCHVLCAVLCWSVVFHVSMSCELNVWLCSSLLPACLPACFSPSGWFLFFCLTLLLKTLNYSAFESSTSSLLTERISKDEDSAEEGFGPPTTRHYLQPPIPTHPPVRGPELLPSAGQWREEFCRGVQWCSWGARLQWRGPQGPFQQRPWWAPQLVEDEWAAPIREPTESAPEPAPIREPTESAPEPAPIREPTESAPEPAPIREPKESAPEPAPIREPKESAPEPAPIREPTESAPVREPTHSAPIREPTHSAPVWEPMQSTPVLDPAPVCEPTEPAPGPAPPWHPCVPIAPGPLPLHGPGPPPS